MPPDPKNNDELLAKPARAKPDERTIFEMAELARQLGFESPEISGLIESSPDHQIARSALLKARKPAHREHIGSSQICSELTLTAMQVENWLGN